MGENQSLGKLSRRRRTWVISSPEVTTDLCEVKLIQLREYFMALGPGAKDGLRKVFNDKNELEKTEILTSLMDPVFDALGINFQYFVGWSISVRV